MAALFHYEDNKSVSSWHNAVSQFRGVFSKCLCLVILCYLDEKFRGQLSDITLYFSGLFKNRECVYP